MSRLGHPPPPTLWSETSPPAPATEGLDASLTADVTIIGAGYAGLSAALHLAEAGKRVVVLEALEIGHGGAGRNNGMVIPALSRAYPKDLRRRFGTERGNRFARLIADSAQFTFDLIRRHAIDCDAVQQGWAQPAHSPGRARLGRDRFAQWQELGADVDYLDRDALAARTGSPYYHGGWLARSGGHLNPLKFVRGLAAAALAAGAQIHTHTPATRIVAAGDGWKTRSPRGDVRSEKIIVATDAYADELIPELRRSIIPVRAFQQATAPLPPDLLASILPTRLAISDTHGDMHFVRPTVDGRLVTGGGLVSGVQWRPRLDRRIAQRLHKMFPAIPATIPFEYAWDGHVAFTLDFLPHLHELGPGLLTVTGYNGRGVALSAAFGRVLADAVIHGRASDDLDLPLTPLNPLPLHGLLRRVAPLKLLSYRWSDRLEIAA